MTDAKFYFDSYALAADFCDKHGVPFAAIHRYDAKRCEVRVPGDMAREIRASTPSPNR
jgi:hypothetical protein